MRAAGGAARGFPASSARVFAGLFAGAVLLQGGPAWAKDVVVLCSSGLRSTLEALRVPYQALSGDRLVVTFGTSDLLKARLDAGAPFDVVVLRPALIALLVKEGRVVEGSAETIAHSGLLALTGSDGAGSDAVGSVPQEAQRDAVLEAGLGASATDRLRAAALLQYLHGAEAEKVMKAKGLEPD